MNTAVSQDEEDSQRMPFGNQFPLTANNIAAGAGPYDPYSDPLLFPQGGGASPSSQAPSVAPCVARQPTVAHPQSPYRSLTVKSHGVNVDCVYDYVAGEPAITSGPSDAWHPGCGPLVELLVASIAGVNITRLLHVDVVKDIESAILAAIEG